MDSYSISRMIKVRTVMSTVTILITTISRIATPIMTIFRTSIRRTQIFFFPFQTFYFVLNKIKYTIYIKYSSTICGLAVGPLVETGHARIVIRAVAVSQAEFTNC